MNDSDIICVKRSVRNVPREKQPKDRIQCPCGIIYARYRKSYHMRTIHHKNYEELKEKFLKGEMSFINGR